MAGNSLCMPTNGGTLNRNGCGVRTLLDGLWFIYV